MSECKQCKGGGSMVRREGRLISEYDLPLSERAALKDSDRIICDKCDGYGRPVGKSGMP